MGPVYKKSPAPFCDEVTQRPTRKEPHTRCKALLAGIPGEACPPVRALFARHGGCPCRPQRCGNGGARGQSAGAGRDARRGHPRSTAERVPSQAMPSVRPLGFVGLPPRGEVGVFRGEGGFDRRSHYSCGCLFHKWRNAEGFR